MAAVSCSLIRQELRARPGPRLAVANDALARDVHITAVPASFARAAV